MLSNWDGVVEREMVMVQNLSKRGVLSGETDAPLHLMSFAECVKSTLHPRLYFLA